MSIIYKILPAEAWAQACRAGSFSGSAVDLRDGFIHLSARHQLAETAAKHFAGQPGLVLVAFDAQAFGEDLKWEPSRGGDLFPHLYAPLPATCALWSRDLPLAPDGIPILPEDVEPC